MRFSYDQDANALAVGFGGGPVDHTIEFDSGTLVDVDASGRVVTIEVINPARRWPLDEIVADFEFDENDVRVLRDMFAGSGRTYAFTQPVAVASDDRDLELVGA